MPFHPDLVPYSPSAPLFICFHTASGNFRAALQKEHTRNKTKKEEQRDDPGEGFPIAPGNVSWHGRRDAHFERLSAPSCGFAFRLECAAANSLVLDVSASCLVSLSDPEASLAGSAGVPLAKLGSRLTCLGRSGERSSPSSSSVSSDQAPAPRDL